MTGQAKVSIPPGLLKILNNLYEIDRKLALHGDDGNAMRNVDKIKDELSNVAGLGEFDVFYEDPMGQSFSETRTDLDATIIGSITENLIVVEVIKPVIRLGLPSFSMVVQKGSVIVKSEKGESGND